MLAEQVCFFLILYIYNIFMEENMYVKTGEKFFSYNVLNISAEIFKQEWTYLNCLFL